MKDLLRARTSLKEVIEILLNNQVKIEAEASAKLSTVISMIDKLAKKNIIHDNKASNLKSKLTKHVAKL